MGMIGIIGSGGMAAAIGGLAAKAGHTGWAKNGAGTWDFALNVDLGSITDTTAAPTGP